MTELGKAIPASFDALDDILQRRPVLWVDPSITFMAGESAMTRLLHSLVKASNDRLDMDAPIKDIVAAFVAGMGVATYGDLVDQHRQTPNRLHRACGLLADLGCFPIIVTRDNLMDKALASAGVAFKTVEVIEDHSPEVQILRLPPTQLYESFFLEKDHDFWLLSDQINVLNTNTHALIGRQHLVLGRLDPDLLVWLAAASAEEPGPGSWRVLTTSEEWRSSQARALLFGEQKTWNSKLADILARRDIRPLLANTGSEMVDLFQSLAVRTAGHG